MSITLVEWNKDKYVTSFVNSPEPVVGMRYVNVNFESDGVVYSRRFTYSSSENSDFVNNYLFSMGYRKNPSTRRWLLVDIIKNKNVRSVRCHRLERKI